MSRHDGKVWVRKLRTHYSSRSWEVRVRNHNGYDYYETFYDWADAMEAADRLARTREVVLPRNPLPLSLPGMEDDTLVRVDQDDADGCVFLTDDYDGESIVLYPHEFKPLALVLYALAEQEESCRE